MQRWIPFALYSVFILAILIGADLGRLGFVLGPVHAVPGFDKLAHALLVGLLALALNHGLGWRRLSPARGGWLVGSLLVGLVFTLEEFSQIWIPGRSFDLGDLAANWTGIGLAGWAARSWSRAAQGASPTSGT